MPKRTVALSDKQYAILHKDQSARNNIAVVVAQALVEAIKESADMEEAFWDTVFRLADVDTKKETVSVDWVNRCIVVKERETKDDE